MLRYLGLASGSRKASLFQVACARRVWQHLTDWVRGQVEEIERAADAPPETVNNEGLMDRFSTARGPVSTATQNALDAALLMACAFWEAEGEYDTRFRREGRAQAALVRELFGNPFRPVAFHDGWRTPTVIGLAARMYESRDFAAMPILADALEDAGCDHPDILAHCRGDGPHVRGCWVVDLVLGKA
jgi:hypothetical protein